MIKKAFFIMRILASTFSVLLATAYIFDLAEILQLNNIAIIAISVAILAIFEYFNVLILELNFDSLKQNKIKKFFAVLPFSLFLFAISFFLTAHGAESLSLRFLKENSTTQNPQITDSKAVSEIDRLQSKIDSLNTYIPKFKSARELQSDKIVSLSAQLVFWQKQLLAEQKLHTEINRNTEISNRKIANKYYYIASVVMILVLFVNLYYVFLVSDNEGVSQRNSEISMKLQDEINCNAVSESEISPINGNLSEKDKYSLILSEKQKGLSQKQISTKYGLSESKISRIVKKHSKS